MKIMIQKCIMQQAGTSSMTLGWANHRYNILEASILSSDSALVYNPSCIILKFIPCVAPIVVCFINSIIFKAQWNPSSH